MSASLRRMRSALRRWSSVAWLGVFALLASSCSLLAPSDEELMGSSARTSPASGGDDGAAGANGSTNGGSSTAGSGGSAPQAGSAGLGAAAGGANAAGADAAGANAAGAGGEGGSESGPPSCAAGFADCNEEPGDGCEVDLRSSATNCGGCGAAFGCAVGTICVSSRCTSQTGCSDRTREAFLPVTKFPTIAGCSAAWPRASLRAAKTTGSAVCGWESGPCEVPADACGLGWHVCAAPPYGPTEVSKQVTAAECVAQPGAFALAVGDQRCDPCTSDGDGAACCGDGCVQQQGDCIFPDKTPWFGVISGYKNLCSAIESNYVGRGVLCCRDPR